MADESDRHFRRVVGEQRIEIAVVVGEPVRATQPFRVAVAPPVRRDDMPFLLQRFDEEWKVGDESIQPCRKKTAGALSGTPVANGVAQAADRQEFESGFGVLHGAPGREKGRGSDTPRPVASLANQAAFSAWSRSAIRSSMCSMPIERRIMSSETPAFFISSGFNWRCVVEAGWQASDLQSPMFTRRVISFSASWKAVGPMPLRSSP